MTVEQKNNFIAAVRTLIAAQVPKATLVELLNKEYDAAAILERNKCLTDITAAINAYEKKYGATFTGKLEFTTSTSANTPAASISTPKSSTISEWLRANNIN